MYLSVFSPIPDTGNEKPWKVVPADVGGRVHLHCEVHGLCKYLYWQRGLTEGNAEETFVNGFSTEEELDIPDEFKNRSRVNETTRSLDLWNLKPSDLAYYVCICFNQGLQKSYYCLNVTGKHTFWNCLSLEVIQIWTQLQIFNCGLIIHGFDYNLMY